MSALSRILRSVQGDGLMFECPGCGVPHRVWVGAGAGPRWSWNGSAERPTFSPSILVRGTQPLADEAHAAWMRGEATLPAPVPFVCHSFVVDGRIQFLADCTHELAGQMVDIPDFDTVLLEDGA